MTDAVILAKGSSAQRPSTPSEGMFRYNSDSLGVEGYLGGTWQTLSSQSFVYANAVTSNDLAYTTPGTYTFVAPAGVNMVKVQIWGGGGYNSSAAVAVLAATEPGLMAKRLFDFSPGISLL